MSLDAPYVAASHQSGGIQTAKAEIIVIHSMECPADDLHVTNWVQSLATPGGSKYFAHFYCGPTVTYRVAPLGRVVPHVGGGNMVRGVWTLGIEQAGYASFTRQQWIDSHVLDQSGPLVASLIADGHGAAVWLTPEQLKTPGVRGVTSHNNMRVAFGGTSHTDPGPNYPIDLLLAYAGGAPKPAPTPTTSLEDDVITLYTAHDAIWVCQPGVPGPKHVPTPAAVEAIKGLSLDGVKVVELQGDKTWYHDILTAS